MLCGQQPLRHEKRKLNNPMKKNTITAEIAGARLAIENAMKHKLIQKRLAACSYDRKKMLEGKVLSEETQMLQSLQEDKYVQQYRQIDAFREQMAEIDELHRKHRLFARLALGDRRSAMKQLKMSGKQKTDIMGQLENLKIFYLLIGLYTEQMDNFKIAPEELEQTQAMVDAAHSLYQDRIHCKGDAQHATQQRDKKRRELRLWMTQFKKAARLALNDEPQLMEVLGVQVRSQKV